MNAAARAIRRFLTSPKDIALIYFLAIPGFAVVYQSLWRELYQSTALFDRAAIQLRREVRKDLEPKIIELVTLTPPGQFIGKSIWHCESPQVLHDREFQIICDVSVRATALDSSRNLSVYYRFVLPDEGMFRFFEPYYLETTVRIHPSAAIADYLAYLRLWYPTEAWGTADQNNLAKTANSAYGISGDMRISESAWETVNRYLANENGRPAPVRGGLGRYLYFSVGTITTLGYGDIAPMTDRVRTLVAIEVILGVVLAGLFLNAVARRGGGA